MVEDGREEIGVQTLPVDDVTVHHRFHLRLGKKVGFTPKDLIPRAATACATES